MFCKGDRRRSENKAMSGGKGETFQDMPIENGQKKSLSSSNNKGGRMKKTCVRGKTYVIRT